MKSVILVLLFVFITNSKALVMSFDECIDYIFNTFDENNDDYLDKWECEKLQYITNPSLPLTWKDYKAICNLTGAYFGLGLEKKHLRYTYYELSKVLGTNIYNDMLILLKYNRAL